MKHFCNSILLKNDSTKTVFAFLSDIKHISTKDILRVQIESPTKDGGIDYIESIVRHDDVVDAIKTLKSNFPVMYKKRKIRIFFKSNIDINSIQSEQIE